MTGITAMLALAGICWLLRILCIVVVPAERLPDVVRHGLAHLAPAALAALVAVDLVGTASGSSRLGTVLVLAAALIVAAVVRCSRSVTAAVAIALAATLVIDLVVLG
jgi:branched-subunit amino acid transport protein